MIGDIFQAKTYKIFISEELKALGYGSRLKLSEALKCQPGYLSQVLNHEADLSFEQAEDATSFFKLSPEESEFFFLLLHQSRAGTPKLKQRWKIQIQALREKRAQLSNRVTNAKDLEDDKKGIYYSRWYYAAVHTLVTVPGKRSREGMRQYLGLTDDQIMDAITFLENNGLIQRNGEEFISGQFRLHLKNDSPFIIQHHSNWRMRAIDRLRSGEQTNLHYSSVYSLSREDFGRIKETLLKAIEEVRTIVRPSVEEELCVLGLDWFFPGDKNGA